MNRTTTMNLGITTSTLALMSALAACGAAGEDPGAPLDPDAPPVTDGEWYRPAAGATWQWQLQGTIDTAYPVDIYDIDLFETGDAVIDELHRDGRRVLCYFSAGSGESYRPDYGDLPEGDLGNELDGYPHERWLDIRSPTVHDVMIARLDLAADRGCDGVEPDNVQAYQEDSGFDLTARDQLAFDRFLANQAHDRGLAIALKNAGDQAEELVDYFDLELTEECHEYEECDLFEPFRDAGKPILNAEYRDSRQEAEQAAAEICALAAEAGTRTLILPKDLDDSFRVSCD